MALYACKYLASPWTLQLPKAKLPNLQPTLNPLRVFSLTDFRSFSSELEMNAEMHANFVLGTLHVGILPRRFILTRSGPAFSPYRCDMSDRI